MCLIITPRAFKEIVKHNELCHLMENMKSYKDHEVYVWSDVFQDFTNSFADDRNSSSILQYYYDLHIIPSNLNESMAYQINKFINTHCPDNALVAVYSLAEFNDLNRTFSNDELIPFTDKRLYEWPIDKILLDVNSRFGG